MFGRVPWSTKAVLFRIADEDRKPAATGDLASIVYRLDMACHDRWPEYSIFLPERTTAPRVYTANSFERLVRKRPRV